MSEHWAREFQILSSFQKLNLFYLVCFFLEHTAKTKLEKWQQETVSKYHSTPNPANAIPIKLLHHIWEYLSFTQLFSLVDYSVSQMRSVLWFFFSF